MEEKKEYKHHNFIMENRTKTILSGIADIISFNDSEVNLFTQLGELRIKGEKLQIITADVDSGDVEISGRVDSICYGNSRDRRPDNFITRIFK